MGILGRQHRERIALLGKAQRFLGTLALGDVPVDGVIAARLSAEHNRPTLDRHLYPAAILAPAHAVERDPSRSGMGERPGGERALELVLGHDEIGEVAPERFLGAIAEEGGELSIDLQHALIQAREHHRVGPAFEQLAKERCLVQQIRFASLALGDVIVRLEHGDGLAVLVALQDPPARYADLGAVAFAVNQLAFPPAAAQELGIDFCQRRREDRLHQPMRDPPEGLLPGPAVQLRRGAIPIGDRIAHVADEDGVVREIEQARLLAQSGFGLQLGAPAREANAFRVLQRRRAQQRFLVLVH